MDSYSKKEAIEILQRALNKKDAEMEPSGETITGDELEKMAAELHISKTQLAQAAADIINTKEENRDDIFPETITTRRIRGKLTDQEIENIVSDLRVEFGGMKAWSGAPEKLHKIGKIWEYNLKDASILIKEEPDGYFLQVIKPQFFHGNNIEASVLAIPAAFILGLIPVTAAFEWIHLYAAILTAAVIYFASFVIVKKYTEKKRSETVSRLLKITEYAEQKMKAAAGDQQIDLSASNSENPQHEDDPQKTAERKLKS